jgi:hypothetical protein
LVVLLLLLLGEGRNEGERVFAASLKVPDHVTATLVVSHPLSSARSSCEDLTLA